MRRLKNVEIAEYVFDELEKRGYNKDFNSIIDSVNVSVDYDTEHESDEYGMIQEFSEEEITKIKKDFLAGFLAEVE